MKKGFLKRALHSIVQAPLVRGLVKSIPFGNLLYEIGENVVGEVTNKIKEEKIDASQRTGKPHNWASIIIQLICLVLIVYSFFTHQISINDVLRYLGFDVQEIFNPNISFPINDTIK